MGFKLFSKKGKEAKAPVDSANSIMKIKQNLEQQDEREEHLMNKIKMLETEAKSKMAKGDKRGALYAMKKRKMYDAERAKIENVKMTLETQMISLEGATQNIETVQAMKTGTSAMKGIRKMFGVDKVDELMDDVREEIDMHREVEDAFSRPVDPFLGDDENELLAELEMLEAEDTKTSLWPAAPASRPAKTASQTTTKPVSEKRFALFA